MSPGRTSSLLFRVGVVVPLFMIGGRLWLFSLVTIFIITPFTGNKSSTGHLLPTTPQTIRKARRTRPALKIATVSLRLYKNILVTRQVTSRFFVMVLLVRRVAVSVKVRVCRLFVVFLLTMVHGHVVMGIIRRQILILRPLMVRIPLLLLRVPLIRRVIVPRKLLVRWRRRLTRLPMGRNLNKNIYRFARARNMGSLRIIYGKRSVHTAHLRQHAVRCYNPGG